MDSNGTFHDKDSSNTVILWKNEIPLDNCASVSLLENLHQHNGHLCKVPTGISEHFSNSVIKTSENFVNGVIAYSKQAVQCYLRRNKLEYSNPADYNSENIMINMNAVQACKDGAKLVSNNYSLFSNPSWLNENGIFDDQVAIVNICCYIKQHWNLENKYLYTVEKSSLKMCDISCHGYKAEFSMSTNEYPIPQVTVSAFFTVNVTQLLSLPAVFIKYQLEMDRRVYVVGRHAFNKKHFERQFKIKRDLYMDINKYIGWSSSSAGPSHGIGFNS